MTRLLITSPDAAAHSAKNAPTAPGPDQPAKDSKGFPMVEDATRDYAAKTRERAVRQLQDARDVMGEWMDLIRQCAEIRVDSYEPNDVAVDPAYREALRLYARMTAAVELYSFRAPAIEAGAGE